MQDTCMQDAVAVRVLCKCEKDIMFYVLFLFLFLLVHTSLNLCVEMFPQNCTKYLMHPSPLF